MQKKGGKMKLTQEEFDLLLRVYLDDTIILKRKERRLTNDTIIGIAEKLLSNKLKSIREDLIFIDKIKNMDINNITYEDILSFIGKRWVLRKGKKGENKVVRVIKDVSEEIQGYVEDKYLDSLHKYKALLEKIVNQAEDIKGGK